MKNIFITIFILLPFWIIAQNSEYFYYYKGEKQFLELNTGYAFVSVKNTFPAMATRPVPDVVISQMQRDKTPQVMQTKTAEERLWAEVKLENTLSVSSYKERLDQLKQLDREVIVAPYFSSPSGKKIGLSNYFYVKLYQLSDTTLLKQKAVETKTEIVGPNQFMPLWYVMSVTSFTPGNAMDMANLLYETGQFQYAQPDLMEDNLVDCANDPLFPQQWGLAAINVCNVWPATGISPEIGLTADGTGVTVAVLDQGIELDHPDLVANIHPLSYDANTNSSPSKVYAAHGTRCAGIIGAVRNNNQGIAGVAPNCQLMSISSSLALYPALIQDIGNGINWAWRNGADIISNSWGAQFLRSELISDAIKEAVTSGRNGLGTVVLAASGNGGNDYLDFPADLPEVIAVGSVDRNFKRSTYSQYGENLSVMAPGEEIWTTSIDGGYFRNFDGTSAACPHAAGVAALILSRDKKLKSTEVRKYLESKAQKVGTYPYDTEMENGSWSFVMGYGMVDATAAASVLP